MAQTSKLPPPSKKRKAPPTSNPPHSNKKPKTHHHHHHHATRQRDARTLATQTTSKAFSNGSLDIDRFVQAREYEIRALEQGMRRSKKALNQRAFQQVPRELRRRGASHDVKRVPKRLRGRAGKEMAEDNTPVRKKKVTRHMRLRLETAKKLRALGARKKAEKEKERERGEKVTVTDPNAPPPAQPKEAVPPKPTTSIKTRAPKIKKTATLALPPTPKTKFRKRQLHKSWLPTHLFHAKRAHMTPPSAPLWRFSIPLTPTQKGYRSTHRATRERGCVVWDVSYFATIRMEGEERSLEGMLKGMGVGVGAGREGGGVKEEEGVWGAKGEKWRGGKRVLETFVFEREEPRSLIAPVTIIWCVPPPPAPTDGMKIVEAGKRKRKLFLRVHPSAFHQVWEEIVRLAKVAKPGVKVEDLRFEIGSIEITGPGSTEALLGALWASKPDGGQTSEYAEDSVESTWTKLAGVTNPATLPTGALLGFNIQDPRLHYPPRTIALPKTQEEQNALLEVLAVWPVDKTQSPPNLFDRKSRLQGAKLPSQKAINRRRTLSAPGIYPEPLATDPQIPVLLYTNTNNSTKTPAFFTLLAPWRTIPPIWYSLLHYPLSTGSQPRFGGLRELQQRAFEAGKAWFPGDFPGTQAGWEWEVIERRRRWEEWRRRPKGKRMSFEKLDLGTGKGKEGEVGVGWACDWAFLLGEEGSVTEKVGEGDAGATGEATEKVAEEKKKEKEAGEEGLAPPLKPEKLSQLPSATALELLKPTTNLSPSVLSGLEGKLITVRLTLLTRGVPQTCARIYRLPSAESNAELRKAWLALLPSSNRKHKPNHKQRTGAKHTLPKDAPAHILQQRLAHSVLQPPQAGEEKYPPCPPKEDLVGFVTSGNFNLAEGVGTGVGCLLFAKVVEEARQQCAEYGEGEVKGMGWLCIIRNSGESVGRVARWEII